MKNLLRAAFPSNSVLRAETIRAAAQRSLLYIIFLTPRSGSSWLTELTMNTGVLGTPQEWFNNDWIYTDQPALGCLPPRLRKTADVNEYVNAIVNENPGVSGLELSVFQAAMLAEMIDDRFDPRWLTASFYLRRRDLAAQAVSLYRSATSGRFHSYQSKPMERRAFAAVKYNFENILGWLKFLVACERRLDTMFRGCGLSPMPLYYEEMTTDPLGTLCRIAHHLGVKSPQSLPATTLTVMRDEISAAWREWFVSSLPSEVADLIGRDRLPN